MDTKKNSLFNYYSLYPSPLGEIVMISNGLFLTALLLPGEGSLPNSKTISKRDNLDVFSITKTYLDTYFKGETNLVIPPLCAKGTPFQEEVWQELLDIPYGELKTYGELAKILAKKRGLSKMSSQAIGQAVGQNPISIIIPCHRVIGANHRLIGYSGGFSLKRKLLAIEGHQINRYSD